MGRALWSIIRWVIDLNYHHLRYFCVVARHKSVSRAARELGVSQPTVSAQLKALESSVGSELLVRTGRELVLTDVGKVVYDYGNEIFTLGRELEQAILAQRSGRMLRLRVGIELAMPKVVAHVLIRPAFATGLPFQLLIRVWSHERILSEVAAGRLDLGLSHEPAPPTPEFRGSSFPLGESGVSFLAATDLSRKLRGPWPEVLNDAPMYLPTPETSLRRALDDWFTQEKIRPAILGEFSDSGMLKVFGQSGMAVFPTLTVAEAQVTQQYRVRVVGRTEKVRERLFAIATDKRLIHPGVAAICKQPRLLAELVDGMPISDIGMLKRIAKRLRSKRPRRCRPTTAPSAAEIANV